MSAPATAGPLPSLVEALRKAIGDSLSEALKSQWSVGTGAPEGLPEESDSALWFAVSASGGLRGEAAIQIPRRHALMLAQRSLKEPNEATAEFTVAHMTAVQKLIQTVVAVAASNLEHPFSGARLELMAGPAPDWQGATVTFVASESGSASGVVPIHVRLSTGLLASMSPVASGDPGVSEPQTPQDTVASHRVNNLDVVLGVELSLNLRFGQRVLTLREILDLDSGSVIELDRRVSEPADLMLGDKLLARGEVVLVDGNYAIRVTEVAAPGSQAVPL